MMNENSFLKLQNGSDVRGVAVDGVEGELVNLTEEAVNRIASGFAKFLADKLGKQNLKIAVGHDSRISASKLLQAVCEALTAQGGLDKADITTILKLAAQSQELKGDISLVKNFALIELYAKNLREKICTALNEDKPFAGMKIIVDAGNGAGGFFAETILTSRQHNYHRFCYER